VARPTSWPQPSWHEVTGRGWRLTLTVAFPRSVRTQRSAGVFTFSRAGEQIIKSKQPPGDVVMVETVFGRVRFHWSASGRTLYIESTVDGVQNLWRAAVDPGTLDWQSVERLTTGGGSDVGAAISRDGKHLAYTQQTVATRVCGRQVAGDGEEEELGGGAFPLDSAAGHLLGDGRPITDVGAAVEFSDPSPDRKSIAYVLARPGTARKELWITHIDTAKSEMIAYNALSPCWSADGRGWPTRECSVTTPKR
jgi:hypothetical protein